MEIHIKNDLPSRHLPRLQVHLSQTQQSVLIKPLREFLTYKGSNKYLPRDSQKEFHESQTAEI